MKRSGDPLKLTVREQQVVRLVSQGKTCKQIAESLSISDLTVKSHMSSVRIKLDASNTPHAVSIAIHHGIINI